jgi:hypothetical protein
VLRIEQAGDTFDFPLTVTLQYTDRKPMDLTIPVTDKLVEVRVPLEGTLRGIDATHDDGTLVEVTVTR